MPDNNKQLRISSISCDLDDQIYESLVAHYDKVNTPTVIDTFCINLEFLVVVSNEIFWMQKDTTMYIGSTFATNGKTSN